jgi:hypothetical protein
MSFSLKREIELYINDTDSLDGCTKLPVLPDFSLEVAANLLQVFRKIIGTDPEMLPRSAVDQINPISIGFLTYLKPAFLDNNIGTTAPEKLLWDSLGGIEGYRGPEYYKPQFGKINRLLPLYIFIKTSNGVYKISPAYVDSVEISFDINYILVAKWTAQAINMTSIGTDVIFTNIKDYTSVNTFIRNKFTKLFVEDYYTSNIYEFPITESILKIQNTLMPVFDKNIKVVTGVPKDLIVGGRAVTGTFNSYLSSRIGHSKEFLENIYSDLTKVNRKYKITYLIEDKENSVEFNIPNAIINVPNLEFQDVLIAAIEFTSSETEYGLNDDIDIKYKHIPNDLSYSDYINYSINPNYYYKFNESSGSTLINYGSVGSSANITVSGTYTWNNVGPMTGSKAIWFNSSGRGQVNVTFDYPKEIFVSYWFKQSSVTDGTLITIYVDRDDSNFRIWESVNSSNVLTIATCSHAINYTITLNTWYHVCIYANYDSKKTSIWINNTKISDNSSFTTSNISGNYISLSNPSGNTISKEYISELIIKYGTVNFNLDDTVNILYNINSINNPVEINSLYYTDYNDILNIYKPANNTYTTMIKKYNAKAYWRFNDNGSDIVVDHITGNYPLQMFNSPLVRLDGPIQSDESSKAIELNIFNNNNQYIYSNNLISTTNVTKQTFIFWVKILNISSSNTCLVKTHDSGTNLTLLTRNTNLPSIPSQNIYHWAQGFGDYSCTYVRGNSWPLKLDTWHCIVQTVDKSINTVKTYLDGNLVSTYTDASISHVWYWHTNIGMTIGKYSYTTARSKFQISEMAYYEYILPDIVIEALYGVATYTPYNIDLTPTTGILSINSNVPIILRGTGIEPSMGVLGIFGNIPSTSKVRVFSPISGTLYILPNKYPTISYIQCYDPIVGTVNIVGNNPNVYIIKVILPQKGSLNTVGKVPILYYYINLLTNEVNIVGNIPSVVQEEIIIPEPEEVSIIFI